MVVSGKTGFQWTYELVVREHILRTVRVELLKTTTAGMEKEREGIYWMTIDLSEPFRTDRVMRWVEIEEMIYSERARGGHPC